MKEYEYRDDQRVTRPEELPTTPWYFLMFMKSGTYRYVYIIACTKPEGDEIMSEVERTILGRYRHKLVEGKPILSPRKTYYLRGRVEFINQWKRRS